MADNRQGGAQVHHDSHGNSVAAWTAVAIVMLAFLLMTVAVVVRVWPLFYVGVVLVVVGGVAGKVLSAMGFGAGGKSGA